MSNIYHEVGEVVFAVQTAHLGGRQHAVILVLGLVDFAVGAVAQLADHVPELLRVAVHPHIVVHLLLLGVTAAEVQHLLDVREERHRAGSERNLSVVRE